ncbi:class I SAM-dependent methyltransferase [Chloroflexota bacterium]
MKKWQEVKKGIGSSIWQIIYSLSANEYRENQLKFLDVLSDIKGVMLLDVGCGNGIFTISCGKAVGAERVYGIEINENDAEEARAKGINVSITDASQTFPFQAGSFDIITANQILEHVLDTDNMLKECYRVLNDGGVMILSVPNLCSLFGRAMILLGKQPTTLHVSEIQVGNFLRGVETFGHIHALAPPALKDLVEYHGFKVEKMVGSGYYPFPTKIARLLARLDKRRALCLTVKLRKQKIPAYEIKRWAKLEE